MKKMELEKKMSIGILAFSIIVMFGIGTATAGAHWDVIKCGGNEFVYDAYLRAGGEIDSGAIKDVIALGSDNFITVKIVDSTFEDFLGRQ